MTGTRETFQSALNSFNISDTDGLDENGPYRLIYLYTWSLAGRTISEGLGSVSLLEEVGHWVWDVRFQKTQDIPCMHSASCF